MCSTDLYGPQASIHISEIVIYSLLDGAVSTNAQADDISYEEILSSRYLSGWSASCMSMVLLPKEMFATMPDASQHCWF